MPPSTPPRRGPPWRGPAAAALALGLQAEPGLAHAPAGPDDPDPRTAPWEPIAYAESPPPKPTVSGPLGPPLDDTPPCARLPTARALGWWAAGASAPPAPGERLTLPRGARLVDQPGSAPNPARACLLPAGEPVLVRELREGPPGFWWAALEAAPAEGPRGS